MFFDEKNRVFRRLKRILRELQKADTNIKRREFNDAFKELRKGYLENKKFFEWLKEKHSNKVDTKDLAYGTEHLDMLFSKTQNLLMQIKGKFNVEKQYAEIFSMIEEMEKWVIWEIKAEKRHVKHSVDVVKVSKDQILTQIQEVDRKLVEIIEQYGLDDPVNFITIINKASEKQKFFAALKEGKEYNPIFSYKSIPLPLLAKAEQVANDVMKQLRSLKVDFTKGAAYLVEKKRINLSIILKLIRAIRTPKVTKYSIQLYGFPSQDLINEAFRELEKGKKQVGRQIDKKLDERRYSADDLKRKADAFFRENNMQWTTVIKTSNEMDGRFKTVNVKREFWVNKDYAPFSERDIIKAIEHEIKVHAYRLEAGRKSPLKILAYGTSGYLPTEEGLTTYFEDLKNATNPKLLQKKLLYVITEFVAIKGTFFDCFKTLTELAIDPETAFAVVVRIKRGLSNTRKKGGFFKDHVYFLGDRLIKEFIASGGNAKDLMGGKIGVRDVKYLIGKYRLRKR